MSKFSSHARWLAAASMAAVAIVALAVPAQAAPGDVSTLAGSGAAGFVNATGTAASFNRPQNLAVDSAGNVFVSDVSNAVVRKITPAGVVTTFVGSGAIGSTVDGTGTLAGVYGPGAMTFDSAGNMYLVTVRKIRLVTPLGVITTLAGTSGSGSTDGPAAAATFVSPSGIAVSGAGDVYISDSGSNLIRKLSGGVVSTFAGSGGLATTDGAGLLASFSHPAGMVFDSLGNLFVAESFQPFIRKIDPAGNVTTFATTGVVSNPAGTTIDAANNLFVADPNLNLIYRVTPGGVVSMVAGLFAVQSYVDGSNTIATFRKPSDVALFGSTLYVADDKNFAIRKIDISGVIPPAGPTTTTTSTTTTSSPINTTTIGATTTTLTSSLPATTLLSTTVAATNPPSSQAQLATSTTKPPELVFPAIPPVTTTSSPALPATRAPTIAPITAAPPSTAAPSPAPTLTVAGILASSSIPASPAPANVQGEAIGATPAYTGSSDTSLLLVGLLALAFGALSLAVRSMIGISTDTRRGTR